ncbi:hypothetical protein IDH28_03170 [Pelagibacterales bacterium SAG-MED31]|nr:hypothetical protein [Pelagibacterales bacterium SAG-MED31]
MTLVRLFILIILPFMYADYAISAEEERVFNFQKAEEEKKNKEKESRIFLSKTIQKSLSILGYYQGSIDGSFGKVSMNALNEWLSSKNLTQISDITQLYENHLLLLKIDVENYNLEKKNAEIIKLKKEKEVAKQKAEQEGLGFIYLQDYFLFLVRK